MNIKVFFTCFFLAISLSGFSQVPVKQEPRHIISLKNELVTLMDAKLVPGDTTLFHIHEVPSVFLIMSSTSVFAEVMGGTARSAFDRKGTMFYDNFPNKLVHRVWNTESTLFRAIDIEIPNAPTLKNVPMIKGLTASNDFDRARTYPILIQPGSSMDITLSAYPVIIIPYTGNINARTRGKTITIKEGHYVWQEGSQKMKLMNAGSVPVEAYIFEIKK